MLVLGPAQTVRGRRPRGRLYPRCPCRCCADLALRCGVLRCLGGCGGGCSAGWILQPLARAPWQPAGRGAVVELKPALGLGCCSEAAVAAVQKGAAARGGAAALLRQQVGRAEDCARARRVQRARRVRWSVRVRVRQRRDRLGPRQQIGRATQPPPLRLPAGQWRAVPTRCAAPTAPRRAPTPRRRSR